MSITSPHALEYKIAAGSNATILLTLRRASSPGARRPSVGGFFLSLFGMSLCMLVTMAQNLRSIWLHASPSLDPLKLARSGSVRV